MSSFNIKNTIVDITTVGTISDVPIFNAEYIQGKLVSTTSPNDGDVLAYSNSLGLYVPVPNGAEEFTDPIAIGTGAGTTNQGVGAVAIGVNAGNSNQQVDCVAIGIGAGKTSQQAFAVAIGNSTGFEGQGSNAVAIGNSAAYTSQSNFGVAVGYQAGNISQGSNSIAIGYESGKSGQQSNAVAIGNSAGFDVQGSNAVAIGNLAGQTSQVANSIVINASGVALNSSSASLFIDPIIGADLGTGAPAGNDRYLAWDTTTKRVTYNSNAGKTFVIQHPLDTNKYLVHACLEGPETGVYYRGKGEVVNGVSTVKLPAYTETFYDFTVQVTPIYNGVLRLLNCSNIINGEFKVYGSDGLFNWHVTGKRGDIIVEQSKDDVELCGNGPYLFLKKMENVKNPCKSKNLFQKISQLFKF